jgi:putative ABC transport system permease protein
VGIACCVVIYLFVRHEYSYDKFHKNGDRIYRLNEVRYQKPQSQIKDKPFFDSRAPDGIWKSAYLPLPLGPTLKEKFPEIQHVVRGDKGSALLRKDQKVNEESVLYVDADFFEVFSFPLLRGNPQKVLSNKKSAVLSRKTARKYFGDEDPMGKSVMLKIGEEEEVFTVTGIAKEAPDNSSIQFNVLVPIQNRAYYERNSNRWTSFNTPTFVEFVPNTDVNAFKKKLDSFVAERFKSDIEETRTRVGLPEDATVFEIGVEPISDIHLDASVNWTNVSNPLYSYILSGIAILILLIACINYVTLALTRSVNRVREVGIRKVSGAHRLQIAWQFWGETQLLTLFAMIAGLGLAELFLPLFNQISGESLSIRYSGQAGFLAVILGITFLTGLIAGSYPAVFLARFSPAEILKGMSARRFKPRLTKGLLVLQYSLSVFLIISSVIMIRQMDFVSQKDLGYNKDQLVGIPTYTGWNEKGTQLMQRYRNQLNGVPGVVNISGMAPALTKGSNRYGFKVDGEYKTSYIYYIDENFIKTMGMELVAGRDFSADRPSDKTESIIINQALAKSMGWEHPVGKLLPWKGKDNPSTVIGVVKDFNFQSLETPIEPMLLHMDPDQGGINNIMVRIGKGEIAQTLPRLKKVWSEVAEFTPFDYWFLDDAVAQQYASYKKWLQIMSVSTFIAILIACLGLFGLAGIAAINRTKEIGIRKVLGAGIRQIIVLLNKDIVKLILLSIVIAGPVSWYVMEKWLTDFAYRIDIGPDVFLISAMVALLVAFLTVSYHSVKAALVNPVDSLRNE